MCRKHRAKLIALLLGIIPMLTACDRFQQSGVGEIIGLKFGMVLSLPIKVGPRDPPVFNQDLREFYELTYPNPEFDFVGVAVTKNYPETEKIGMHFAREKVIWGAMFSKKGPCKKQDYERTLNYIKKNWSPKTLKEYVAKDATYRSISLYSPSVAWDVSCGDGIGLSLVVRDYSVLRREANPKGKELVDKSIREIELYQIRKMD